MIAMSLDLMTSSEIISKSLHTHFQASAWALGMEKSFVFQSLKLKYIR